MQSKDIESYYISEPFKPFNIRLADGRVLRVSHRESIAFVRGGRSLIYVEPDETSHRIDMMLIVSIDDKPAGNGASNGKRRKSA